MSRGTGGRSGNGGATDRGELEGLRVLRVDIADLKVSDDPRVVLATHALGSCVTVVLHDPVRRAGGMIHYMLPLGSASPDKARANPAMFADEGVPLLFRSMYALGCQKENLVVKVAGAGSVNRDDGLFNIGRRNYTVLRKIFWKNGVLIAAEDVGGCRPRTVRLLIRDGTTLVRAGGTEYEL